MGPRGTWKSLMRTVSLWRPSRDWATINGVMDGVSVEPDESPEPDNIRSGSGQWAQGVSGNPSGRPPGTVSKVTVEQREWCIELLRDPAYQESVRQRILAGEADHIETLVWYYALGKPKNTVKIEDDARRRVATIVFLDGGRRDPLARAEGRDESLVIDAEAKTVIHAVPRTVRPAVVLPEVSFGSDPDPAPER